MKPIPAILEPIGLAGSPLETIEALETALRGQKNADAIVVLLTDWAEHREQARVAVLVLHAEQIVLSQTAFGGRYGEAGRLGLCHLLTWLLEQGVTNFKEAVFAPHELQRLLDNPNQQVLVQIRAIANPIDPAIYCQKRS